MNKHTLPTVVIVGRPNVGKSSVLNRLVGTNHAIVDPTAGVTRDRNYATAIWNGRSFEVIDTGGLDPDHVTPIQESINTQVDFALNEADTILFLCDARDGLQDDDKKILKLLRKKCSHKPLFVSVNKVDNPGKNDELYEFFALGVKKLYPISAVHGHGVADLLDDLVAPFPVQQEMPEDVLRHERIAIVGKPNVGKSALLNRLLGYTRTIVDDKPGTTRDAITVNVERDGKTYRFIDTAGLRRPARQKDSIEFSSVFRTLTAIKRSDIAVLMLDANEKVITEQDKRVAARVLETGSACIIVWNKWDLLEDKSREWEKILTMTRNELHLMEFAPVISISAKSGLRIEKLYELIDEVRDARHHEIPHQRLQEILNDAMVMQPPPPYKGRPLRMNNLRRLHQSGVTFKLTCNETKGLHFSYRRYLLNHIRQEFRYDGWPVRLLVASTERERTEAGTND